jgi:hypothetical protein
LEGKISWALNVFTYIFFNWKCVHTWANGTGYTSIHEYTHFIKEEGSYICAHRRSEEVRTWIESFW